MQLQQKSQGRAQQTREKTSDVSEFLKASEDYAGRGTFEVASMETSKARSITEPSLSWEVWNRVRSYATAAYLVLGILAWGLRLEVKRNNSSDYLSHLFLWRKSCHKNKIVRNF